MRARSSIGELNAATATTQPGSENHKIRKKAWEAALAKTTIWLKSVKGGRLKLHFQVLSKSQDV